MEAKLVRFYGFSDAEVSVMSLQRVMMYWKAIDMLEAQETILNIKVSSFSNMDEKGQKELNQTLEKQAYFKEQLPEPVYFKTSQIAGAIGA